MSTHEYDCIEGLGSERARIRFQGTLQGEPVEWEAVVQTLRNHACRNPDWQRPRNFIEVGDEVEGRRQLHVCIDVERIDHPVLLKTIHMIRHYKRLAPGRHEYGPVMATTG